MNGSPSAGSPNSANTALKTAWHSCFPVMELPSVAFHPRDWFVSNLKALASRATSPGSVVAAVTSYHSAQ